MIRLFRRSFPLAFPLTACLACSVLAAAFAQTRSNSSEYLESELSRLETSIKNQGLDGSQKRQALADIARLRRLSGDPEGAAEAWTESAFAEEGVRDDGALLAAAESLVAIGELEKAFAHVKLVLLTSRDRSRQDQARYLGAQIEALVSSAGVPALAAFAEDMLYADKRPATLFLLWALTGDAAYQKRLLKDHPSSPEALIAKKSDTSSGDSANSPKMDIDLAYLPFWMLLPGRASIGIKPAAPDPTPAVPRQTVGPGSSVPPSAVATAPISLQIGLFSGKPNAENLLQRLLSKGFSGKIQERRVKEVIYWSVVVPAGNDSDATVLRLKDAGFEAFPLFN